MNLIVSRCIDPCIDHFTSRDSSIACKCFAMKFVKCDKSIFELLNVNNCFKDNANSIIGHVPHVANQCSIIHVLLERKIQLLAKILND